MQQGTELDNSWMEQCRRIALAAKASGDAMVGAIIVRRSDNTEVASGQETVVGSDDITGHAEINALREAVEILGTKNMSGCTLYTTTEPCWMCSYLVRELRVGRIVIGGPLFDIGGASSAYPILRDTTVYEWGPPPDIVFVAAQTRPA
jgi:tRNA(adenine34) deaminase